MLKKSWDYLLSPHSSISLSLLILSLITLCWILNSFPSLPSILLYPYLISFSLSLSLSFLLLFCCILLYFLLSLSSYSPVSLPHFLLYFLLLSVSFTSFPSLSLLPLCNPLTGLPIRWRGCPTRWVGATVARSCCRDIQGRPWQLYRSALCGWSWQVHGLIYGFF